MANTKISALTSATTPLAGTETLPVVQSSTTTKVTVANLTAGRSVSGSNFVVTSSTIPANGIYLPAANSVGIATNSALRATFDATGQLGIGTVPAAKLHVVSTVAEVVRLERTATDVWRFSLSAGAFLFTDVTAASERWRVDTSGTFIWRQSSNQTVTSVSFNTTIANALTLDSSGNLTVNSPAGLGYGTGAGGTVTQATSRVTGVTLNKPTGSITLVSAAGLATFQSFTVTNSTVAATDVVHVTQKSGTDLYQIFVTATAAGSFRITFATTGGVTIEQPVFNFAVIKGVTA
ncbi:hypothetical protein UFOVP24_29 [uncultured Caudovirales phage]|uniref:Uncharacterized protein n=1 Tax=uncultured Caudovirales phage TaxID=2100421 RepID=A0A6J5TAV1_9CAUD|nr:hypothetical protein UFOVP24_29 [uncultured Caudovirales phage]